MNYRRVLLLTELGHDLTAEVAAIRRVAPQSERLIVLARTRASYFAWFADPASADPNEAATGVIERLLEAIADLAPAIQVTLEPDLELEQLTRIAEQEDVDLVVTGALLAERALPLKDGAHPSSPITHGRTPTSATRSSRARAMPTRSAPTRNT